MAVTSAYQGHCIILDACHSDFDWLAEVGWIVWPFFCRIPQSQNHCVEHLDDCHRDVDWLAEVGWMDLTVFCSFAQSRDIDVVQLEKLLESSVVCSSVPVGSLSTCCTSP